jgi:hypothetical protein
MAFFCVDQSCSLLEVYRRFTGACCLCHKGHISDKGGAENLISYKY